MLARIKKAVTQIFLGDTISETEEIYRSPDGKFRIHLGLYRKGADESLWIKFVQKGFLGSSSASRDIQVDSFQSFATFLATAVQTQQDQTGTPYKLPFPVRFIEGITRSTLLGEYHSPRSSHSILRLISYTNRRQQHRIALKFNSGEDDDYSFAPAALYAMWEKIAPYANH